MKGISLILLPLTFGAIQLYGQEFYEDGSMKLSAISSDKEYGYTSTPEMSIKVGEIKNQQAFLRSLLGPNGETIRFRRVSSCCGFASETALFGEGFLIS